MKDMKDLDNHSDFVLRASFVAKVIKTLTLKGQRK